jgi:hypothetical protein
LGIRIFIVDEGSPVEEVFPYIADGTFHFALGLGSIWPARSESKLPVLREARELYVLYQGTALKTLIGYDHFAHLKEQFPRHSTKEVEGCSSPPKSGCMSWRRKKPNHNSHE